MPKRKREQPTNPAFLTPTTPSDGDSERMDMISKESEITDILYRITKDLEQYSLEVFDQESSGVEQMIEDFKADFKNRGDSFGSALERIENRLKAASYSGTAGYSILVKWANHLRGLGETPKERKDREQLREMIAGATKLFEDKKEEIARATNRKDAEDCLMRGGATMVLGRHGANYLRSKFDVSSEEVEVEAKRRQDLYWELEEEVNKKFPK